MVALGRHEQVQYGKSVLLGRVPQIVVNCAEVRQETLAGKSAGRARDRPQRVGAHSIQAESVPAESVLVWIGNPPRPLRPVQRPLVSTAQRQAEKPPPRAPGASSKRGTRGVEEFTRPAEGTAEKE